MALGQSLIFCRQLKYFVIGISKRSWHGDVSTETPASQEVKHLPPLQMEESVSCPANSGSFLEGSHLKLQSLYDPTQPQYLGGVPWPV